MKKFRNLAHSTSNLKFCLSGVIVDVGMKHVEAFIPMLHLTDVPMTHPERKFSPGDKLHCRVLRVDPAKHRIHLTSKPILVKRDDYEVVQSFDVSNVGKVTEGVVVKLTDRGLLLQLFGEAQGWVPKTMISTEVVEHPEKLFFLGQALKCQVVRTGNIFPEGKFLVTQFEFRGSFGTSLVEDCLKVEVMTFKGVSHEIYSTVNHPIPDCPVFEWSFFGHFLCPVFEWSWQPFC
jgi:hypothetical protein